MTESMHVVVAGDQSHKITFKETAGADIGGVLFVAALVEEPTDLVHPQLTDVTLHPALLRLLIILLLLQLRLYRQRRRFETLRPEYPAAMRGCLWQCLLTAMQPCRARHMPGVIEKAPPT